MRRCVLYLFVRLFDFFASRPRQKAEVNSGQSVILRTSLLEADYDGYLAYIRSPLTDTALLESAEEEKWP